MLVVACAIQVGVILKVRPVPSNSGNTVLALVVIAVLGALWWGSRPEPPTPSITRQELHEELRTAFASSPLPSPSIQQMIPTAQLVHTIKEIAVKGGKLHTLHDLMLAARYRGPTLMSVLIVSTTDETQITSRIQVEVTKKFAAVGPPRVNFSFQSDADTKDIRIFSQKDTTIDVMYIPHSK